MPTPHTTILLATDHSGSVLNAVDTTKNNPIVYTSYGDSPMGGAPQSQLRFNGVIRESMTGCYSLGNGYRTYRPILMRFSSPDSLSPFGKGGLSAYAYCGGDPRNRTDPTGHVSNPLKGLFNVFGRQRGLISDEIQLTSKHLKKIDTVIANNEKELLRLQKNLSVVENIQSRRATAPQPPPLYAQIDSPPSYGDALLFANAPDKLIAEITKTRSRILKYKTEATDTLVYLKDLKYQKKHPREMHMTAIRELSDQANKVRNPTAQRS